MRDAHSIVGVDVQHGEDNKEAASEPEVVGHEGQQDQVETESQQVDQSLLAPVLGGQVGHVAVESLVLGDGSLGGAASHPDQATPHPGKAENWKDKRTREEPGEQLDEHHQVVGDVGKHPPPFAIVVKTGADEGSKEDPADHASPVLEDPGEGGREGGGGGVAHADTFENSCCGETAGDRGGKRLDSIPDLDMFACSIFLLKGFSPGIPCSPCSLCVGSRQGEKPELSFFSSTALR